MANKDKNKNSVILGAAFDTSTLKQSANEVVKIISQMTSRIAKEFARMSNFKVQGYTPIAEKQKEFTYEGTAAYEQSLNKKLIDLEKERTKEVKRREKLLKSAKTEKTRQRHKQAIESAKTDYDIEMKALEDELSNIDYDKRARIAGLSAPVRTKFSTKVKDGIEVAREEQFERNLPSTIVLNAKGKEVELLKKEVQYVKTIFDFNKKVQRIKTRNVVIEEKLTNEGKKNEIIADETLETEDKLSKQQLRNAGKNKNKGFLGTLFARFKSVAIYRFIRNTLKEIANAFRESLDAIAVKSDKFNESFSRITSSIQQVKMSMGAAFYQVLIALEPVINSLSQGIVSLANGLSLWTAQLNGSSTYLRVNEEYLKNYRDTLQGTLLEFDTFKTLNSKQNNIFEEESVEGAKDSVAGIKTLLGGIVAYLTTIAGFKLVDKIKEIKDNTKKIKDDTAGTKNESKGWLDNISTAKLAIAGISALVTGIYTTVTLWNDPDYKVWEKVLNIYIAIAAAAVAAAVAFKATHNWAKALSIGGLVAGTALTVSSTLASITKFENGGNFRTGDFFVANENGNTELIASSNSGGGSVMNLDQWAQISEASFFNALSRYDAAQNGGSGGFDMDKLGTAIARSSGFRNEINRRNVGLNLV